MKKSKMGLKTTLPWWQRWRSLFTKETIAKLSRSPQNTLTEMVSVGHSIIIISLIITTFLVALRKLGWTEAPELSAYDQFMQWQPVPESDDRLLIVGITEEDIQLQQDYPLSDQIIHQLLLKLEAHKPRIIGLDIYRDIPQNPGREEFMEYLQQASNKLVTVCQLSKGNDDIGVPAPPGLSTSNLGFADFVVDEDGVIRRSLLWANPLTSSKCQVKQSFSLQLTRHYLQQENIKATTSEGTLFLGSVPLIRLQQNTGGYQTIEEEGYQILLNYHSPDRIAEKVSLTDVLEDRIDPNLVRDRIILIGVTAPSLNDFFYTPYSSSQATDHQMSGLEIHAQIISQLLNAVLDEKPLMGAWSESKETLWILGWAWIGGILSWKLRHPLVLAGGIVFSIVSILGSTWILFQSSLWVPLFSPTLGLLLTSSGVLAYRAYQTQKIQQQMTVRVKQQKRDLQLLQTIIEERTQLGQKTGVSPDETTENYDDDATQIAPSNSDSWTKPMTLLGGRYHITKVLGAGGFGQTYLAEDVQRPKHPACVIKHLRPTQTEGNFFQVAQRLFQTEAEILEILGQHNQIPRLFAYFEEYQEFYLVEEYIPGNGLSEELGGDKRLGIDRVLELIQELLDILVFVHQYQVIHRDIKPSNIIRRQSDRRLCLIDFGAVKQLSPQLDETTERFTVAIGTKGYAAPEQLMGQPRLSSDVYSLGIIAIHALTGITPQKLRQDWSTGTVVWHHLADNVDVKVMDFLDRMVSYHFRDRYQSASEAMEALKAL